MKLNILTVIVSVFMIVSTPIKSQKKDIPIKLCKPIRYSDTELDSLLIKMKKQSIRSDSLLTIARYQNKHRHQKR